MMVIPFDEEFGSEQKIGEYGGDGPSDGEDDPYECNCEKAFTRSADFPSGDERITDCNDVKEEYEPRSHRILCTCRSQVYDEECRPQLLLLHF